MASDLQGVAGAIYSRLSDSITTVDATWTASANVAWPGVDFTPPDQWVRPTIVWGDGFMETHGISGTNTVTGVLTLSLFDRPGSGYGALNGYADTIRDLFDRATLYDGDLIGHGSMGALGGWSSGGGWSITGGVAVASSASGVLSYDNTGSVSGVTYNVAFTVAGFTGGGELAALHAGGQSGPVTEDGRYSFPLLAGVTDGDLQFGRNTATNLDLTLDDVSVSPVGAAVTEFFAASGPRQVNTNDTHWLQVNVSIPFVFEETS